MLALREIVTIQAFIAPARCRLAVALADHDRFRPGQPNQEFQLAIRLTNAKKATGTTLSKLVSRVQTGGTLNPESREMIMIISPFRAILLIGASFLPGFAAESGRLQAGRLFNSKTEDRGRDGPRHYQRPEGLSKHVFLRNEPTDFGLENSTYPSVIQWVTR